MILKVQWSTTEKKENKKRSIRPTYYISPIRFVMELIAFYWVFKFVEVKYIVEVQQNQMTSFDILHKTIIKLCMLFMWFYIFQLCGGNSIFESKWTKKENFFQLMVKNITKEMLLFIHNTSSLFLSMFAFYLYEFGWNAFSHFQVN